MKTTITLLLITISFFQLFGQSPVLVTDFNQGSADSFDEWNYLGTSIGDYLILPVSSNEVGLEPGVYSNGTLSILKDINEGSASSNPSQFTEFNGKVYFSANNASGGALYVTDGTPEGTEMLFEFTSGAPVGLIVANPNHLYFSSGNTLFRTNGVELENMFSGIRLRRHQWGQNANFNLYRGNFAFALPDASSIELYIVEGSEVVKKAIISDLDWTSNRDIVGLNELENGLIFGLEGIPSSSEALGTYLYNESDSSINKMFIEDSQVSRYIPFNSEYCLGWVRERGYYIINGQEDEETLVVGSSLWSFPQNESFEYATSGDQLAFVAGMGGSSFRLHLTNGHPDGTIMLDQINSHRSNMIQKGNFAFIASGTSNGFTPQLIMIDFENKSSSVLHTFNAPSLRSRSVQLVAVHEDRLFFTSNLDQQVGRELYYLELGFSVNTEEITPIQQLETYITNTTYSLKSDTESNYQVEVFSINGQLVESGMRTTNTHYDYSHLSGMHLIRFTYKNQTSVEKVVARP
ncbi:MAG: T9SS C-terminal target domain-containing protein [Saprospirales bacterium]|nr:MAG: T9SS C-terminal target domain-containing protein [Saprospirales bacterium]